MTARRILSVGQCGADHAAIRGLVRRAFDAEVVPADSAAGAFDALREEQFDLVLANRIFDRGGSGFDLIESVKADPSLKHLPVILVSDLPEAQQRAEAMGAVPGFGKSALGRPETVDRLAAVLNGQPKEAR